MGVYGVKRLLMIEKGKVIIMSNANEIQLKAPLFRDPIYDSATDPTIIWNKDEKQWYLFYTQRRAVEPIIGYAWIHGTDIGVASSKDGSKWLYRGTLPNLAIEPGHNTFWAPEIIWARGEYHMYVTYITGVPNDWDYERWILHYTSDDLWNWKYQSRLDLDTDRAIDVCVYEIESGLWKMWFKNECKNSHTYTATSNDLYHWEPSGVEIDDCPQEGPNVFELGGYKWMISDFWSGLAVYRSDDFTKWVRQENILESSGTRQMDQGLGHHADVLVRGERAYIFYFCHPYSGDDGDHAWGKQHTEVQRAKAMVQVAELKVNNGILTCDRNANVTWL